METVVQSVLPSVPQAAAIWLALLLTAVLAFVAVSAPALRRRANQEPVQPTPAHTDQSEALRYAEEVGVAARRAVATADRRRAEWLAAQDAVDAAWRAFDDADRAVRRLTAAAGFPVPRTPRTPAEFAARERHLHRSATAACRRRELSVRELSDVLAHRNGWDPRWHPVQQEVVLRRAAREHLLRTYHAASAAERSAWHAADLAAAAARSLQDEAWAAALRAPAPRPGPDADALSRPRRAGASRRLRLAVR